MREREGEEKEEIIRVRIQNRRRRMRNMTSVGVEEKIRAGRDGAGGSLRRQSGQVIPGRSHVAWVPALGLVPLSLLSLFTM